MRLLMIATGYLPYLFSENLCNAKLVYALWPEPYKHHLPPSKQASKERFTAKMLRAADINTFPSDSLRRHFASFFPFLNDSRTEVVPHIGMAPSLMAFCKNTAVITRDEDPSLLTLCHSGNMSGERNPEHLFTAMRQLIDEGHTNFRLDIMGRPNPQTDQLVARYNLRDHVRCIGSFGYMEAVNRLHAYDVLVLLEAILDRGIFFASKFTDYAQTSLPILAVSPPDGFARDILAAHGGGLHADNTSPAPIRDALLALLRHKANNTLHTLSSANLFAQFAPERVVEQYKSLTFP